MSTGFAALPPGVIPAAKAVLDANFGETFSKPAAADLTRKALKAGAQTRDGERNPEAILHDG